VSKEKNLLNIELKLDLTWTSDSSWFSLFPAISTFTSMFYQLGLCLAGGSFPLMAIPHCLRSKMELMSAPAKSRIIGTKCPDGFSLLAWMIEKAQDRKNTEICMKRDRETQLSRSVINWFTKQKYCESHLLEEYNLQ